MTAAARGWGPGWPECTSRSQAVTITVGELGIKLSVHKRVAPLFARMIVELEEARGAPFHPGHCWGGACRAVSGTSTPSNHSWWLATDLCAPENPYASRAWHRANGHSYPGGIVVVSTMPMDVQAIAAKYGMRWGGVYYSKPDPMHFEFMGTPEQADALVALTAPKPPPPPPPPVVEPDPTDEVPQEDDVRLKLVIGDADPKKKWWLTDGMTKRHVPNRDFANILIFVFDAEHAEENLPIELDQAFVDWIPEEISVNTAEWDLRISYLQAVAEGFDQFPKVAMTPDGKIVEGAHTAAEAKAAGAALVNPAFQFAYETLLRTRSIYDATFADNGEG